MSFIDEGRSGNTIARYVRSSLAQEIVARADQARFLTVDIVSGVGSK